MKLSIYSTFVFIHVVSAILSIGPLFVLIPIIGRLRGVGTAIESAYLSVINTIIRMVMHAGHVLVFTGTLLIILGPWPWYSSWVIMTLVIMLLSAVFLAKGFTLVLRKLKLPDADKNKILDRLNLTSWIYIGLLLIMLWLMVQKPMIW